MKRLVISESEKKQIIELHMNSNKKKYLNEKSEKFETPENAHIWVVESCQRRLQPQYEIEYEGDCVKTSWLDNAGPRNNIYVLACKGGYFEIGETTCYKKFQGRWGWDNDTQMVRITIDNKSFENMYKKATAYESGALFDDLLCYVIENSCMKWKTFWKSWSWNADDFNTLANENGCQIPNCFKQLTSSGFLDKTGDLLSSSFFSCD